MRLLTVMIFLLISSSACDFSPDNKRKKQKITPDKTEVMGESSSSEKIIPSAKKVLFLGDSLTAGYGVAKADSFVGKLQSYWELKKPGTQVINAGVSGSTSASCSKRLKWQLRTKTDFVVIALGANDGLRGFPVKTTFSNIDKCIQLAKENGLKVVLAGMLMPQNYGEKYRAEFEKIFKDLNKKHKPVFIPFLLEGVGGKTSLNLSDGIHPNEKGHQVLFERINKVMEKLL